VRSGSTVDSSIVVRLLGSFLGLVADAGSSGRSDGTTNDGTGRSGDRATDHGPGGSATERAGSCPSFVVALDGLTGDRTGYGADAAADDRTDRPTYGGSDRGATERPGTGPDGLGPVLVPIAIDRAGRAAVDGRVVAGPARVAGGQRVIMRMLVRMQGVVLAVHGSTP
jgi:hypothetical protein